MNLIIDIGNSRAKLAVFENNKILKTSVCLKGDLKATEKEILNKFPFIENGILANVASPEETYKTIFSSLKGFTLNLTNTTSVPFKNNYTSKNTLGLDRIALATAATTLHPQKNVLIIDAGTCITYDLVTADATYLGGAISPGMNMRYRSMNNFTANLPLLRASKPINQKIGTTTKSSLKIGVTHGILFEIDAFINQFKAEFPDLTTVLTGGDAKILSKSLKNTIFVSQNFLLFGLNRILEYNKP